ncbi:MAG: hypothetical protein HC869_16285 [Rhodospirillales bacterium]|nr:hypothetical protein [Rhodospirillales bacterium]
MVNVGKCPKCEKVVRTVNVERIDISAGIGRATWVGVSYVCPTAACRTVLGVEIDPIALKADIVKEVRKAITGK